MTDVEKRCPRCDTHKVLDEFPLDKNGTYGRYGYCKECKSSYMREAGKRRTADGSNYRFRLKDTLRRYGVTVEWFENRMRENDGRCEICGTRNFGKARRPAIDHNHTTGEARGLLCGSCNQGLGAFKDSPELLKLAIEYLRKVGHYGTRNQDDR